MLCNRDVTKTNSETQKKEGGGERPRERREMPCHSHNSDKFQRAAKKTFKKRKKRKQEKEAK